MQIENINWYPGHMKKTRELIQENLKAVDLVIEIIDSRIPVSSRNPVIDELTGKKTRMIILNKVDLADPDQTEEWLRKFRCDGNIAISMDSKSGKNLKDFYKELDNVSIEKNSNRKMTRPLRMMIVGVPNVGKSSFINRLVGKKSAKTGDRPGVTRGKQWVTLENGMQLLDTPGILWPKFEDPKTGLYLAFCGSIKDEIMDVQDLAFELISFLQRDYPDALSERYDLECIYDDALQNMDAIADRRGFLLSGGRIDYERTGTTVLDEFRSGKLGRITLERNR